ncbi:MULTISPECIES: glycine cleavage system protein H [Acidianus]|uniref:Probable glycine cleavage system H protein n=1 Tax=Candidatus Acidianus copahuensis TaxID=1160895 RepID=A0A031LKU2_9CREN|nr:MULTISPECIES: glycine cleavage system protein H [Acidianus]EZQ01809.1 glycine cleavage system protein H [Candidatus Acidianus copahuensis]NON63318.1 glycine cleavage system protein H [Acidianus sp. RZ1]
MEIKGFVFPDDLLYDEEKYIWIKDEGEDIISVGITDIGQYMAGKIFQVEVKQKGEEVNPKTTIFTLESAKWVGKFRLPINGEILDINDTVVKNPDLLNENPYSSWIVKLKVTEFQKRFKRLEEVKEFFEKEADRIKR